MDELVKVVIDHTGLPEDQARVAAEAVIGYLQEHLPEPAAGIVADFARGPEVPGDDERKRKAALAAAAATTAAVNVVVLPHAH
jgi:hypothetical protein